MSDNVSRSPMANRNSLDEALREVIRAEIASELQPLRAMMDRFQGSASQLQLLTQLAERLAPLLGVTAAGASLRAPKRRGRPPGSKNVVRRAAAPTGARRGPKPVNNRPCAIKDCARPARTKGYCAAHYQKLRMLARTDRLPPGWKDFADPHSVEDVVLPRGRAASKALKDNNK